MQLRKQGVMDIILFRKLFRYMLNVDVELLK